MNRGELDRLSPALRSLVELARESPDKLEAALGQLTTDEQLAMLYLWDGFWARPEQVWRPGAEAITVYMCGRGWGKTRTGAEAVRWSAENPESCGGEMAIAGRTAGQRDRDMIYGTSGIMTISPPGDAPEHRKSDLELVWSLRRGETAGRYYAGKRTRCRARLMSGDVPASFRGPGFGLLWADELPHWAKAAESWSMATFTMREGEDPRVIITTTPIPTQVLLEIVFALGDDGQPLVDPSSPLGYQIREGVRVVTGSTYANRANLASAYFDRWIAPHEGTRLGNQEIHGQLLLDVPTALWRHAWLRRCEVADVPRLVEIVVAVDPAGSHRPSAAETGIVAAGRDRAGVLYYLADSSGRYSPNGWAREAVRLFDVWGASRIVGERNYGGDMVESNVLTLCELPKVQAEREQIVRAMRNDKRASPRPVVYQDVNARRGKIARGELVCGRWERGEVFHVGDSRQWVPLEHQLTHTDPSKPIRKQRTDRFDAAVHAALALTGDTVPSLGLGSGLDDAETWGRIGDMLTQG